MRTSAELEIVREIKEKCCCVALNYEVELSGGGGASSRVHYTLPDGQVVSLTKERFRYLVCVAIDICNGYIVHMV